MQAHDNGTGTAGNPLMYALVGISGVAAVLLGIILVLVVRGPGREEQPAPRAETLRAQTEAAAPVQPLALTHVAEPAAVASDVSLPRSNDPQEIIRRLKDATVYLKNKINGRTISSGSGFVIETNGNAVTLATNRHVAVVDLDELPESIAPKGSKVEIEAVFRSGEGPSASSRCRPGSSRPTSAKTSIPIWPSSRSTA